MRIYLCILSSVYCINGPKREREGGLYKLDVTLFFKRNMQPVSLRCVFVMFLLCLSNGTSRGYYACAWYHFSGLCLLYMYTSTIFIIFYTDFDFGTDINNASIPCGTSLYNFFGRYQTGI